MDRDDTECYRTNPNLFFALSPEEQIFRLNDACGVENYVFKIDSSFPSMDYQSVFLMQYYNRMFNDCLKAGDWNGAAKLLFFFRISHVQFLNFTERSSFYEFIKHFPFGCFCKDEHRDHSTANTLASCWCDGYLEDKNIIREITSEISDVEFENVIQRLPFIKFRRIDLLTACKNIHLGGIFANEQMMSDAMKSDFKRRRRLLGILSQMVSYPTGKHCDDIVYPCMIPFGHQQEWCCFNNIPGVKRPVWSKQRHRELVDKRFKETTMTVLLIQKFRWTNFPLAKDLLPMMLGFAFDAHVAWMEETLALRTKHIEIWHRTFMERGAEPWLKNVALNFGILTDKRYYPSGYSSLNVSADLYDLIQGQRTLPKERIHEYRASLVSHMRQFDKDNAIFIRKLPKANRYVEHGFFDIIEDLLRWAASRGRKISDIYGKVHLISDEDVADFVSYIQGKKPEKILDSNLIEN